MESTVELKVRVLEFTPLYSNPTSFLSDKQVLLGDSAYSLTNTMIVPYSNLNQQQRAFNYLHSATKVIVENAFGLFKGNGKLLVQLLELKTKWKIILTH